MNKLLQISNRMVVSVGIGKQVNDLIAKRVPD
jgi:hypothetical protein